MIKNVILCSLLALTPHSYTLFSSEALACELQQIPEKPQFAYQLFNPHPKTHIFTFQCKKVFLDQANKDLLSHFIQIDPIEQVEYSVDQELLAHFIHLDKIHLPEARKNDSVIQDYIKAYAALQNAVRIVQDTQKAFISSTAVRDIKSVKARFDRTVRHANQKALQARKKMAAVVTLVAQEEEKSRLELDNHITALRARDQNNLNKIIEHEHEQQAHSLYAENISRINDPFA